MFLKYLKPMKVYFAYGLTLYKKLKLGSTYVVEQW